MGVGAGGSLALVAGCARTPPEQAVRQQIEAMQAAIDARDAGAVDDCCSPMILIGEGGLDRRRCAAARRGMFLRYRDISAKLGPATVELRGGAMPSRFNDARDRRFRRPAAGQRHIRSKTGWRPSIPASHGTRNWSMGRDRSNEPVAAERRSTDGSPPSSPPVAAARRITTVAGEAALCAASPRAPMNAERLRENFRPTRGPYRLFAASCRSTYCRMPPLRKYSTSDFGVNSSTLAFWGRSRRRSVGRGDGRGLGRAVLRRRRRRRSPNHRGPVCAFSPS